MQFTVFNFVITHRLRKTNLTDTLLRHSDYKDVAEVSETMKQLLLTLQRKLVTLNTVFSSQYVKCVLSEVQNTDRIRNSEFKTESLKSFSIALTQ